MPNPPEAAELILRALLPADARECVSGDLLEEYRESRVPSAGELRADLWYWRQVGGIWLRAYWWLVAPVVLVLALFDTFNYVSSPLGPPSACRQGSLSPCNRRWSPSAWWRSPPHMGAGARGDGRADLSPRLGYPSSCGRSRWSGPTRRFTHLRYGRSPTRNGLPRGTGAPSTVMPRGMSPSSTGCIGTTSAH